MSSAASVPREGPADRFFARPWPFVAVVAVLIVAPLLILGELSAADTRQRNGAAQVRVTADLAIRATEVLASRVLEGRDQIARLRGDGLQNNALRQGLINDDLVRAAEAITVAHATVGPDVLRLFVVGPDGRVLVASPAGARDGEDLASAAYVRDALAEIHSRVRAVYAEGTGRDAIPVAVISAQFMFPPRPGLALAPGSPPGAFGAYLSQRVLVAELDLSRAAEWLKPLLVEADDIYLVDVRGRLITRAEGKDEALRDLTFSPLVSATVRGSLVPGSVTDPLIGGTRLAAGAMVPEVGWHVLAIRDPGPAGREVEGVLGQLQALRLLLAAFLLVGAFALARGVQRVLVQRRALAISEVELQRAQAELRGLNEGLQQRVDLAVREIERSRLLRRYLPHQVADAIIASGDDSILQTHRREITVAFTDLRGFTAFAETAAPEVVMRVLQQYHGSVGELISRFGGTLEHFEGDGVMVYFNDPLPQEDHTERAVRMALATRERVGELARSWQRFGFELDFGVGIAVGYATLGTIGFEGRHDYGAIGTVTNLASRLSDEAKRGQIVVSQHAYALVEHLVDAEAIGSIALKGFLRPVSAYNIVALKTQVIGAGATSHGQP